MKIIDSYKLDVNHVKVDVKIFKRLTDFVPRYYVTILNISRGTKAILEMVRQRFINELNLGEIEISGFEGMNIIKQKFKKEVELLIDQYIPNLNQNDKNMLISYVIMQDIGLGNLEALLKDESLEEVVVNGANEPVWVYHRKYGWLKTNVILKDERQIKHYSTMIGKDSGKEINLLKPLMDANLLTGDRVNATLNPISSFGNTITIRKFRSKPWTVVDFINSKTMSAETAALLWQSIQNELSILISGGTASGKTSTLNVLANFFPPNQRIISIEDTRELTLPKSLHWVPMETRQPNPEGKGGVSMLDLVVNSLRMRPDRIVVGEIRRKKEAEVLFEAMQTGHSVYGTVHANNASETILRMTNPPIDIPKLILPALSLVLVQYRNRRTGLRRTLQIAEVTESGDARVIKQLDVGKDIISNVAEPKRLFDTISLYTGMTRPEIKKDIEDKTKILKGYVKRNITDIHKLGLEIANYYIKK